jgi:hypothetical protein
VTSNIKRFGVSPSSPIHFEIAKIAANNTYLLCEQGKGKAAIVSAQEATTKSDAAAKKDARANMPGMKTKAVPAPLLLLLLQRRTSEEDVRTPPRHPTL